jgi:hypothetical protein
LDKYLIRIWFGAVFKTAEKFLPLFKRRNAHIDRLLCDEPKSGGDRQAVRPGDEIHRGMGFRDVAEAGYSERVSNGIVAISLPATTTRDDADTSVAS